MKNNIYFPNIIIKKARTQTNLPNNVINLYVPNNIGKLELKKYLFDLYGIAAHQIDIVNIEKAKTKVQDYRSERKKYSQLKKASIKLYSR